jgi:cytochrome c oxidase subunit 2
LTKYPRLICASGLLLGGCSGVQSALSPAGDGAEKIANLFWWMTAGAAIVWAGVLLLALYAVRAQPNEARRRDANRLIVAGGVIPAIVLLGLLTYGLSMLPPMIAPAPAHALKITVYGEQWWWRIRYEPPGRQPFDLANEVRLPVSEPTQFFLHSTNVIHSFWIPSLGGKVDLIPGRINRLALRPTRTGHFRGACAEFCGRSHAHMTFEVIVLSRNDFERWMMQQSAPAAVSAEASL